MFLLLFTLAATSIAEAVDGLRASCYGPNEFRGLRRLPNGFTVYPGYTKEFSNVPFDQCLRECANDFNCDGLTYICTQEFPLCKLLFQSNGNRGPSNCPECTSYARPCKQGYTDPNTGQCMQCPANTFWINDGRDHGIDGCISCGPGRVSPPGSLFQYQCISCPGDLGQVNTYSNRGIFKLPGNAFPDGARFTYRDKDLGSCFRSCENDPSCDGFSWTCSPYDGTQICNIMSNAQNRRSNGDIYTIGFGKACLVGQITDPSNGICQYCPDGWTSTVPTYQNPYQTCIQCPAGSRSIRHPVDGSVTCERCPLGTFSVLGATVCSDCPVDYYCPPDSNGLPSSYKSCPSNPGRTYQCPGQSVPY